MSGETHLQQVDGFLVMEIPAVQLLRQVTCFFFFFFST